MKIIICGAGQVGGQIARHLAREEGANQVTVIDRDPALIRRLTDAYDVNGIAGFASHPDVLERAGARDADMIIAATQSDEVNMVVCQVANSIFSVPRKIARLRAPSYLNAIYSDLYRTDHLPIDVVISPEFSVADAVMQRLAAPAAFDIEGFLDNQAQLVGISLDTACAVLDTPLRQLSELFSTLRAVVVGVRRADRLFVPEAADQLYTDDQIYVMTATEDLPRVMEIFGKTHVEVQRVLIVGAGNIGLHVAQSLEAKRGARLKIIERNRARAEAAADALKRTVVLHGDGLDVELLEEANVASMDAVLALTDDDKVNILACVRAKTEGAKLVVALVNDPSLIGLIAPMGIDAYVNPRSTTVSSILRYVRHGRIRAVYSIGDGEAEVIEAQVLGTSAIAGRTVRDSDLPEATLIGLIKKGDKVIVPKGDTRLAEGDVLTIFAMRDQVADVERLFQVGLDFFLMALLRQFPAFVVLILIAAGLMLVPALHATRLELWPAARTFLYHAVFFTLLGFLLGLATMNRRPRNPARYHLLTLLLAFVLLPLVLAAPLVGLVPTIGLGGAYFEMLSCLTTTGATLFDRPQLLSEPLHLWRALVGWLGGLGVLVTAFAILAPLNLGGFEIGQAGAVGHRGARSGTIEEATVRVRRAFRAIAPVYAGLTGALAFILILAGDSAFVALCHAMATLSTSGISPVGGLDGGRAGRIGELAIAVFLLPAVSYQLLRLSPRRLWALRLSDPQLQLMLISVLGVTAVLFLRSFVGAVEIDRQDNLAAAVQATWGSLFTVLSFLTTTGFESHDWRAMQLWSDLPDPAMILLAVAVMGGGIATTAGGVKLLRLYALYRHGLREMDKLIHPSSLGRRGQGDQMISEGGPRIAFIFLMLFLTALAVAMLALSATGLSFEHSLGLAIAGLTTTGPAIATFGDGLVYRDLSAAAQVVLCATMIVGRMDALVIVALFNPTWWRH